MSGAHALAWRGDPADIVVAFEDASAASTALAAWLDRVRPDWHRHAACAGAPTEMFFPTRGASVEPAKQLCAGCPVAQQCLDEALDDPELVGIRAGTSAAKRAEMRRADPTRRRRRAPKLIVRPRGAA